MIFLVKSAVAIDFTKKLTYFFPLILVTSISQKKLQVLPFLSFEYQFDEKTVLSEYQFLVFLNLKFLDARSKM